MVVHLVVYSVETTVVRRAVKTAGHSAVPKVAQMVVMLVVYLAETLAAQKAVC